MKFLITGGSGFIGTNLIGRLIDGGHEVMDVSLTPPLNRSNEAYWRQVDVLDHDALVETFQSYRPEIVIHLAARTDCDEKTTVEEGYRVNTEGTANVLEAIKLVPTIRKVIITSSQFVCGPGYVPKDDTDYGPHTVYGQSKVMTEKLTRGADLKCTWTLIRPTNIWGPWHVRYSQEFWRIARKGLYFHPAGAPVIRCYGFVGTVIDQILRILELSAESVHGKTFYVGDEADDIYLWANSFCVGLCGKRAPKVPRAFLQAAGMVGDIISRFTGKPFYITSSRYRSMVSNYQVPLDKTYSVLGRPTRTLEDGVRETVEWLNKHPDFK